MESFNTTWHRVSPSYSASSAFFLSATKPPVANPLDVKFDYSVEIPTRCNFVIEFIIPKFIEGSTCFEWHIAHHQEL